ncbi:MAG TPA: Holliday junction branch migration protein RuvA [Candidatus Moranbacteria bacterium]|nr:Holliday junction branch migration protein RuvA [Candidatus Moranbacteria bacterium]
MIAKIKGKIEYLKDNYAVVEVNGIGYKVFLSVYTFGKLASLASTSDLRESRRAGQAEANLFIHTHVREDAIDLYGFLAMEELEMFELLISISGVGPKSGLGILTVATPNTIKTAILNEDSSILTKVSGIGKKTAERVILELRNKVADMPDSEKEGAVSDSDAIEALVAMGYSVAEARDALKMVPSDIKDIGQRVTIALKNLGRK